MARSQKTRFHYRDVGKEGDLAKEAREPKIMGKRRCFKCEKFRWVHRHGRRPNGVQWFLCRPCHEVWVKERKAETQLDEEMWASIERD